MIVKKKKRSCIVLTPDGKFEEVSLPKDARVGQEIELKKVVPYFKQLIAAASILLLVVTGQLYPGWLLPAAAYVSLDINPSVELSVDAGKMVITARALNADGGRLLSEVKVKRHRLPEAIELLVFQAMADGYLKRGVDNTVVVTLTVSADEQPEADFQLIYDSIERPLVSGNLQAEVVIEPVKPEQRAEARKEGLSAGRYVLYRHMEERGIPFAVEEMQQVNLRNLKEEKNLKFEELLQDPPGYAGKASGIRRQEGFVKRVRPAAKEMTADGESDKPGHGLERGMSQKKLAKP